MTVTRPPGPDNEQSTPFPITAGQCTSRLVWTGFALIAGVLVGVAAGLLSAAGGVPVPLAILAGGTACASTIPLVLALLRYVAGEAY